MAEWWDWLSENPWAVPVAVGGGAGIWSALSNARQQALAAAQQQRMFEALRQPGPQVSSAETEEMIMRRLDAEMAPYGIQHAPAQRAAILANAMAPFRLQAGAVNQADQLARLVAASQMRYPTFPMNFDFFKSMAGMKELMDLFKKKETSQQPAMSATPAAWGWPGGVAEGSEDIMGALKGYESVFPFPEGKGP